MDGLVTAFLIFALIIGLIVSGVFVSFELYSESAYMMQTSGKLVTKMANSTMFKQLNDSIWDPEYQTGVDNMVETAYISGRDYISTNIHYLVGGSKDQTAVEEIETKVLELWDRMYQYCWRENNWTTAPPPDLLYPRKLSPRPWTISSITSWIKTSLTTNPLSSSSKTTWTHFEQSWSRLGFFFKETFVSS